MAKVAQKKPMNDAQFLKPILNQDQSNWMSIVATLPKKQTALINWYRLVRRDLPWRKNREPYRIWVSEIMLQQTTVAAVVPYFERFMARFPDLNSLASASLEEVYELWAGLGYYSRARNLHRAANLLFAAGGFPRSSSELINFPGFGPYTSRAVASLAFDEKSGVLDGNVIRILTRHYGLSVQWWQPSGRNILQNLADHLAQTNTPADLNQGMMELGATVCTSKSPACTLCPWMKTCDSRIKNSIDQLPLQRPRRARETWAWSPQIKKRAGKVLLVANDYAPFLKGHMILPGHVQRLKGQPRHFSYKGTITHYDIYVVLQSKIPGIKYSQKYKQKKWVSLGNLKKEIPSSLIRKAIESNL